MFEDILYLVKEDVDFIHATFAKLKVRHQSTDAQVSRSHLVHPQKRQRCSQIYIGPFKKGHLQSWEEYRRSSSGSRIENTMLRWRRQNEMKYLSSILQIQHTNTLARITFYLKNAKGRAGWEGVHKTSDQPLSRNELQGHAHFRGLVVKSCKFFSHEVLERCDV